MIPKKQFALLTLAACALALPLLGSTKNPITRVHKVHATALWIVDPLTGSGTTYQVGEATHFGRSTTEGTGTWNLLTSPPTLLSASVTSTAVDGSQVLWKIPGTVYQVELITGTGRAAKVLACGFNTVWMSEPEIVESPIPGMIAFTLSYRGEGTVTY